MAEKSKDFNLTDESIDILANKIHQLEFVDFQYKLNVYSCRQCNMVAIKHRIANCQHVFCHECYAIYYGSQCPVCETVITGSTLDDEFTKAVLNFKVSCEFKKNGCQTVVQLGDYLGHIEDCRLATKRLLPKLYKANPQTDALEQINANLREMKNMMQGLQLENKQLKDAMEEMKEENARQMTAMTAMTEATIKHEEKILKINKSTAANTEQLTMVTNQLNMMTTGKTKYEEEIVKIKETITEIEKKFQDNLTACTANAEKLTNVTKQMTIGTKKHDDEIVKMKDTITAIENTFKGDVNAYASNNQSWLGHRKPTEFLTHNRKNVLGETLLRDLNAEVNSSDSGDITFNWTIRGVRQKLENCKKHFDVFDESEEFYIPSRGMKFWAKLSRGHLEKSSIAISLHFTSIPTRSPPFLHCRKYVLVDRSKGREGKQDFCLLDQPYFGQNSTTRYFTNGVYFPISFLRDSDKYVKNDEVLIRIIFEPIAKMFKGVSSMKGTLLVRIDNYTQRKRDEVNEIRQFLSSESFYTSNKGLRMDMEIFLNGYESNKGKGISIYPMFRIGEWDDSHSFPIRFKYKRILIDQSDALTKRHISCESGVREYKTLSDFSASVDFMSKNNVEKYPYLKDDSLLIKFFVEIVNT